MKHQISLQTAIGMTTDFRKDPPAGMARSEAFERDSVERLLNTPGCERLRIYYGKKEGSIHAILVAVDKDDRDILPSGAETSSDDDDGPIIIQDSYRCPPFCPPNDSPLNS